jgi:hypothetical protein
MRPLIKVPLRYGAIAGVLGAALVIGLFYIGSHPFLIPPYLDFRIILFGVFIFFTLKELRDYWYGGALYFWQGLLGSLIFTIIFALTASILLIVFVAMVPQFRDSYVAEFTEYLKALPADDVARIGKDTFERNLKELSATNGFNLALIYSIQSFVISFFMSIIMSVVTRRQPQQH